MPNLHPHFPHNLGRGLLQYFSDGNSTQPTQPVADRKRLMKTILKAALVLSIFLLCLISAAGAEPLSPNVSTFATGLIFPRGLEFGPDGNLYVAEAGSGGDMTTTEAQCEQIPPPLGPAKGGFTSRISKISPGGIRTTVADALPSTADVLVGDTIGIADVAFIGNTLFALSSGAGCGNGLAGTNNAVLRVNANGSTTQVANLSAFIAANPTAKPKDDDFTPDGVWYSLLAARGDFFVAESNQDQLVKITAAGQVSRVVDLSVLGYRVPTALAYDGDFYIGNLSDFPFGEGASEILKITPDGQVSTFASGFTAIVGLAFDALHRLYVLENTTGAGNEFPTPGTGRVSRLDAAGRMEEIATGLSLPTAMTFGPDGNLYVSNGGFGDPAASEILKVDLQPVGSELANISTRSFVQTGENVMIGGFILRGTDATQKVLIRALGPSLAQQSVGGFLADPTLDLRDGNGGRLAFNDNWKDDAEQSSQITATGIPPQNDLESAIVADLAPGAYTAIVAGTDGATGVALVEFYNLGN